MKYQCATDIMNGWKYQQNIERAPEEAEEIKKGETKSHCYWCTGVKYSALD
jgi:hypothetical protein